MTYSKTVQFMCDADKTNSGSSYMPTPSGTTAEHASKTKGERLIGLKPNFENGYVTMNEDGLAIAMVPKQTETAE